MSEIDTTEKVKNVIFAISGGLNAILIGLFIWAQIGHPTSLLTPMDPAVRNVEDQVLILQKQVDAKRAELKSVEAQVASIRAAQTLPADQTEYFSLDRDIYQVKFRTKEQREIWIQRNNSISNFSEELIDWLRNHDEFYVGLTLNRSGDKFTVDKDSYILLPPCPANLNTGEQPTIMRSRVTIIKKIDKATYQSDSGV